MEPSKHYGDLMANQLVVSYLVFFCALLYCAIGYQWLGKCLKVLCSFHLWLYVNLHLEVWLKQKRENAAAERCNERKL